MPTVTSPVATDETLQATNTALGNLAKDSTLQTQNGKMDSIITKLQGIIDALGLDTSVYKASGSKTCAELISSLLIAGNLGNVYNVTDSGTTTADFVEGAGKPINAGDNVAIVDIGTGGSHTYKFDLLAGMVDISGKADKVSGATSGNFASLDANGNLTDSGHKHSDYVTKVSGATNGNLAGLDANGNLTDSGVAKTDIDDMQDELSTDSITVTGNPINFSTLSAQNAESTIIDLEPIQDLHGFDKPWVGGAGKNKLECILTTAQTKNGITATPQYDSSNNLIGYKLNGIATANADFNLHNVYESTDVFLLSGTYKVNNTGAISGIELHNGYNESSYSVAYGSTDTTVECSDGIAWTILRVTNGTACDNIIVKPMIRLSTESDATFAPYTNICPISGRSEIGILGCGKNLLSDGTNTNNGYVQSAYLNSSGEEIYNSGWNINEYFRVEPNTSYVWSNSKGSVSNNVYVCFYDKNKQYISGVNHSISPKIMTTPSNAVYARGCSYSDTSSLGFNQIEKDNQATQYTTYQSSNDLTISLGQTVYGGTLDVENGVLVVDRAIEDLGNLSWNKQTDLPFIYFSTQRITDKNVNIGLYNFICSDYNNIKTTRGSLTNGTISIYNTSIEKDIFCVRDDRYSSYTGTDFKAAMSGVQLVYELATPITINLTPHTIKLLEGVNNISTDGDKITLTYRDGKVATLGDVSLAKALDTNISNPTNGQVLKYDSTEGKWKNANESGGGSGHNYSTTEQVVGTWIDGKPLYEKTVNFGALPNNSSKNVNHNISNLDYIVNVFGYAEAPGINSIPIPFVNTTSASSQVAVVTTSSEILLRTVDDRSAYTKCYVTLQYTKTTAQGE